MNFYPEAARNQLRHRHRPSDVRRLQSRGPTLCHVSGHTASVHRAADSVCLLATSRKHKIPLNLANPQF